MSRGSFLFSAFARAADPSESLLRSSKRHAKIHCFAAQATLWAGPQSHLGLGAEMGSGCFSCNKVETYVFRMGF